MKVTLDRLRKTARLQNDKPQEVSNLSYQRFGYENDLVAEANISFTVDKLYPELRVKWKDHIKTTNQQRPSLVDFCSWLKAQAEIYDDCYSKTSSTKFPPQSWKNRVRSGVANGTPERQNTFSGSYSSRLKPANLCPKGNGQRHNLSDCSIFKALSVEERLSEVQKLKLCFFCLRPAHWLSNCAHRKQCGVNGCPRPHDALLHPLRNVTSAGSSDTTGATGLTAQGAVTSFSEHSSASHKSSSDSVLLQVVPVTLYSSRGYFNTYAMLDTGSTRSLLPADVSQNLGLNVPSQSVLLNGIQKTLELLARRVNVQVSPLNVFGTRFDVNRVLVVEHLNVPERKVDLRESQVTLLLESDVPELIVLLETRCGPNGWSMVDGRNEVPLIFKDQNVRLPENRIVAVYRLKLDRELAEAYKKTVDSDLEKGYIKKLTKEEATAPEKHKWYLPHHPVLNPRKPGKVRRVCDAASKYQGSSLNSHLLSALIC